MSDMTIGFAITGSFCTFKAVFPQMNLLWSTAITFCRS